MSNVVDRLSQMWTELLDTESVTDDSDFFDCGGDSITAVHLAAMVQEEFAVVLDALDVVKLRTFGKISESVRASLAAS